MNRFLTRTIGILGGMGPEATADLFAKIVRATPARRDQDHLRILVDSNPAIPDRAAALAGRGPDPRPAMIETLRNLVRSGADLIVMPCNTAHVFYEDLQEASPVPILHIMEEVSVAIRLSYPHCRTVGLLATTTTIRAALYHRVLEDIGVSVLIPDELRQRRVMRAIYGPDGVKAGRYEAARVWIRETTEHLFDRGADLVILGCTELPLLMDHAEKGPILDATTVLARAAVREALRDDDRAQV